MRSLVAGALAACIFVLPAAAADFAARYDVEGSSPGGGGPYSGTVSIKKTSEVTYQVVWQIGNDKFIGTGIGSTDGLAIAYKSGSDTGIAIYSMEKGGRIEGYWTYAGGKSVGSEKWTPQ